MDSPVLRALEEVSHGFVSVLVQVGFGRLDTGFEFSRDTFQRTGDIAGLFPPLHSSFVIGSQGVRVALATQRIQQAREVSSVMNQGSRAAIDAGRHSLC